MKCDIAASAAVVYCNRLTRLVAICAGNKRGRKLHLLATLVLSVLARQLFLDCAHTGSLFITKSSAFLVATSRALPNFVRLPLLLGFNEGLVGHLVWSSLTKDVDVGGAVGPAASQDCQSGVALAAG